MAVLNNESGGSGMIDLIGLGTGLIGGLTGIVNYQNQQEQQQYDRHMQELMMQREDTAVQRRAADLEAAGMSKTLAAGSSASAGPVVRSQAPQAELKEMQTLQAQSQLLSMEKQKAETERIAVDTALQRQKLDYLQIMNPLKITGEQILNEGKGLDNQLRGLNIGGKEIQNEVAGYKRDWEKRLANVSTLDSREKGLLAEIGAKILVAQEHGLNVDKLKYALKWYMEHNIPESLSGDLMWKFYSVATGTAFNMAPAVGEQLGQTAEDAWNWLQNWFKGQ